MSTLFRWTGADRSDASRVVDRDGRLVVSYVTICTVEEAQVMKKVNIGLVAIGIAFMAYSCTTSCGPGPGQSTSPVTYPSGYTIEKQGEKEPSK